MKKLIVAGLSEHRDAALECLKRTQRFHLGEAAEKEDVSGTESQIDLHKMEALSAKQAAAKFGIELIERGRNEFKSVIRQTNRAAKKDRADFTDCKPSKVKKPMFAYRNPIDYNNFMLIASREMELTDALDKLKDFAAELEVIRVSEPKLTASRRDMLIYNGLKYAWSECVETGDRFILVGTLPLKQFEKLSEDKPPFYIEKINAVKKAVSIYISGNLPDKESAEALLKRRGFRRGEYDYYAKPSELIAGWEAELKTNYARRVRIYNEISHMGDTLGLLKIYYDYLSWEMENVKAQGAMLHTKKTFVFSGWYPEPDERLVLDALKGAPKGVISQTTEAEENELPPTLTKNGKIVSAYTGVTNMFSVPHPKERDPNFFVAVFFILFFGVMMGDIGYGLTLLVASLFLTRFMKMEKGTRGFMILLATGGVSGVVFGVLTGGLFGFVNPLFGGFIDPVNDFLVFFGICLGLGIIQLISGLALKAAALIKERKYFDALCDAGFMMIMLAALVAIVLGVLFPLVMPPWLGLAGYIAVGVSLAGLILFGGRKAKGFFGKLGGGFGKLYGLINYFTDILSYSRLFSIAVSGCIIGMVANQLGETLWGMIPIAGPIIGIGAAVLLHTFNIALSVLGIYVHNSRLQFVEFFGKFYVGGGYEFTPFGSKTKYVRVVGNS